MIHVLYIVLSLLAGVPHPECPAYMADRVRVRYVAVGQNTQVMLVNSCGDDVELWYVSYFEGHAQPDLWRYWEIQNTASSLLRDVSNG